MVDILDVDRIAYLDCDLSVLADISPLLRLPLKAAPVAAALNDMGMNADISFRQRLQLCEGAPYLNAGVLVVDVKDAREDGIFRRALRYPIDNAGRLPLMDQDALNAVLDGRWQLLDWRWNVTHRQYQSKPPFIRHFIGPAKPWSNIRTANIEPVYIDQWRSDLLESPWPERFMRVGGPSRRPFRLLGQPLKTALYRNFEGPRGDKARALLRYKTVQAELEKAAAECRLAPRFPEKAISRQ